jgi:hypothetical protein
MIPIMPWCTLGDPLPYITGSYYKATTFFLENNVIPLGYVTLWGEPFKVIFLNYNCGKWKL